MGFFASWNSLSTLSTSGMTFMSAPEVAKSQLELTKHLKLAKRGVL
jgi:hypothetical protein